MNQIITPLPKSNPDHDYDFLALNGSDQSILINLPELGLHVGLYMFPFYVDSLAYDDCVYFHGLGANEQLALLWPTLDSVLKKRGIDTSLLLVDAHSKLVDSYILAIIEASAIEFAKKTIDVQTIGQLAFALELQLRPVFKYHDSVMSDDKKRYEYVCDVTRKICTQVI